MTGKLNLHIKETLFLALNISIERQSIYQQKGGKLEPNSCTVNSISVLLIYAAELYKQEALVGRWNNDLVPLRIIAV